MKKPYCKMKKPYCKMKKDLALAYGKVFLKINKPYS